MSLYTATALRVAGDSAHQFHGDFGFVEAWERRATGEIVKGYINALVGHTPFTEGKCVHPECFALYDLMRAAEAKSGKVQ